MSSSVMTFRIIVDSVQKLSPSHTNGADGKACPDDLGGFISHTIIRSPTQRLILFMDLRTDPSIPSFVGKHRDNTFAY